MVGVTKVNFIKFLESLEVASKNQKQQLDEIIARLKKPDIEMTSDQHRQLSLFITALFCGAKWPNLPMTDNNRNKIENYSAKHINKIEPKPAAKPGKKK